MNPQEVTAPAPATTPRLLRMPEVLSITGFKSPDTIYRMVKAGSFPVPRKLSAQATAWRLDELEMWINSRPAVEFAKAAPAAQVA